MNENGTTEQEQPAGVEASAHDALVMREQLLLAGKLADAARQLVGGKNITVGSTSAANIFSVGELATQLRIALDEYDNAIVSSVFHPGA